MKLSVSDLINDEITLKVEDCIIVFDFKRMTDKSITIAYYSNIYQMGIFMKMQPEKKMLLSLMTTSKKMKKNFK